MARSNSTLSGCFEPRFASGLLTFLLVQPMLRKRTRLKRSNAEKRRTMQEPREICSPALVLPDIRLAATALDWLPSAKFEHFLSDRRYQTRHCPQPGLLPQPGPHPQPYRVLPRHLLRFENSLVGLPATQ